MVIRVHITSYRKVKEDDDTYTVFLVEVWVSGRHHTIEKRYSEFEDLHKQLKKVMKTPEFPPKKVLKWNAKVLEQRRHGLDTYFQGILEHETLSNALLMFLETDMLDHSADFIKDDEDQQTSHQHVITLDSKYFLQEPVTRKGDSLPDIVNKGVTVGLYTAYAGFLR